jgi:hypothetical protein
MFAEHRRWAEAAMRSDVQSGVRDPMMRESTMAIRCASPTKPYHSQAKITRGLPSRLDSERDRSQVFLPVLEGH